MKGEREHPATVMRLLKWAAVGLAAGAVVFGVLYQFMGLRVVLTGGARPRLTFAEALDERALEIERHRAAQREAAENSNPAAGSTAADSTRQGPAVQNGAPVVEDSSSLASAAYWTSMRGPERDGHYREHPVRTTWPTGGLKPLWQAPIGGGYASFSIANGRAFTIEQRGRQELVAAYDVVTGRELWTHGWPGFFEESMGGDGPRATPTWSDGLIYALGALGELRCLDAQTGRLVWRKNILDDNDAENLPWGMAASPLIVDDTVVVLPGGPRERSVVAYNRRSGARVWSALSETQAYVSPMLVTLAGQRQLIVVTGSRLVGLAPDGGQLLWSYPWETSTEINVAQPIVIGENRVFISSGYDQGAAVVEVASLNGRYSVREVWRNNRMKNKFTSSVLHEGFIYGLDESILACIDAATGVLKWKGGRYGYGQVLLASNRIIVVTEEGDLVLVAASPRSHEELARFHALDGKTWNHLAMTGGHLLVRNMTEMAAFDLRVPPGQ